MNLLDFVATVVVVTASGALAPGPLSFGILMQGSKEGARSGFSCAIGHTLVEFPLVLASIIWLARGGKSTNDQERNRPRGRSGIDRVRNIADLSNSQEQDQHERQ